jgi:hypothetical protein
VEFGTVLWIIVLVVAPVAAALFAGAFGVLDQLGTGGLSIDEVPPSPSTPAPTARLEREAEIRQLVQARHDRQLARGEQPVDVEAEVSRLLDLDPEGPAEDRRDAALREEVRQLVVARNERRAARGEPALDVEAEIDRQLRDISPGG